MGNGDAPNFRVAKAEEEGSIRLIEEEASDILLANKADDQPGRVQEKAWLWVPCTDWTVQVSGLLGQGLTDLTSSSGDSV